MLCGRYPLAADRAETGACCFALAGIQNGGHPENMLLLEFFEPATQMRPPVCRVLRGQRGALVLSALNAGGFLAVLRTVSLVVSFVVSSTASQ